MDAYEVVIPLMSHEIADGAMKRLNATSPYICYTRRSAVKFSPDMLDSFRGHKIQAIKALRTLVPDLGLKDAKDIVEAIYVTAPTVKDTAEIDRLNAEIAKYRNTIRRMAAHVPNDVLADMLLD